MTTDTTSETPTAASPSLLERAKADFLAALRDAGHPAWAAERLFKAIEAFVKAHLEKL